MNASFDLIYASANAAEGESREEKTTGSRARLTPRGADWSAETAREFWFWRSWNMLWRAGARIYGEVIGFATCGCGSGLSQSDASAILRCLELVCRDAGIAPEAIDYVSAHATATVQGDREEAAALRTFFGARVPVSSLKGHLGHTLGASGRWN